MAGAIKPETTTDKTFDLSQDERDIMADALSDWLDGRSNRNAEMTKIAQLLYDRLSNV